MLMVSDPGFFTSDLQKSSVKQNRCLRVFAKSYVTGISNFCERSGAIGLLNTFNS